MTQSPSTQPASSKAPRSLWNRRNLTIIAVVILSVPFLGGLVEQNLFNLSTQDGQKFWSGVVWTARWEVVPIGAILLVLPSIFPRVRTWMEMPNIHGDERERMIVQKASNFAYTVGTSALLILAIAFIVMSGDRHTLEIPAGSPMWACLAIQFSFYGSMIYYNKKI